METTFERDLLARTFQHQYSILGAKLVLDYKKQQSQGDIQIPAFMIEQQAMIYASNTIQQYMANGSFKEEYEKAWESIKDRIPDNYTACN